MNTNKDYYAILGVLPTAEDVVIRAAYKALAQRYHPDRYSGSAEDATEIMKNINKAYQVLSDPRKRKEYDDQRKTNNNNSYETYEDEDIEDEFTRPDPLDGQWKMAVDYYPDLVKIDKRLHNISSKLAYTFRAYLLYEKKVRQRVRIATEMENSFLKLYFGKEKKILNFARKIILEGNREAARELNKAIKLFGKDVDPELVINRVREIYYPEYFVNKRNEEEAKEREAKEREAIQKKERMESETKWKKAIRKERMEREALQKKRQARTRRYRILITLTIILGLVASIFIIYYKPISIIFFLAFIFIYYKFFYYD